MGFNQAQVDAYIANAGGTYTDSKWGNVLGGWKAVDHLGTNGKLNDAHGAWAQYGAAEAAYKASKDLPTFKSAVKDITVKHMHHTPGIGGFISGAISAAGHFAGDIKGAIGKVPGLSTALNMAISVVPGGGAALDVLNTVSSVGNSIAQGSQVVSQALSAIPAAGQAAFKVATGAMTQAGLTADQLSKLRGLVGKAGGAAEQGFDAGIALAIGRAQNTPPASLTPAQQAGYLMAHGAALAPPAIAKTINGSYSHMPTMVSGAAVAHAQIAAKLTLWQKIKKAVLGHT